MSTAFVAACYLIYFVLNVFFNIPLPLFSCFGWFTCCPLAYNVLLLYSWAKVPFGSVIAWSSHSASQFKPVFFTFVYLVGPEDAVDFMEALIVEGLNFAHVSHASIENYTVGQTWHCCCMIIGSCQWVYIGLTSRWVEVGRIHHKLSLPWCLFEPRWLYW